MRLDLTVREFDAWQHFNGMRCFDPSSVIDALKLAIERRGRRFRIYIEGV